MAQLSYRIPTHSCLRDYAYKVDYCDSISEYKQTTDDITTLTKKLFQLPGWVLVLFQLRNVLVKPFGLRKSKDVTLIPENGLPFPELASFSDELIMHATDKHLNFLLSVLKTKTSVEVTTVLEYKMWLGRAYFFLIKPLHILIIKSMLSRL